RRLMDMWTTLRRLRVAHICTASTTTAVPHRPQPEAFPKCKGWGFQAEDFMTWQRLTPSLE
ncbi:MAG: hypothetical protein ACOC6F_02720, partial [bacterium]